MPGLLSRFSALLRLDLLGRAEKQLARRLEATTYVKNITNLHIFSDIRDEGVTVMMPIRRDSHKVTRLLGSWSEAVAACQNPKDLRSSVGCTLALPTGVKQVD